MHRRMRVRASIGDQFFLCERGCVKEGLHWGFAEAPAALMGSVFVVAPDPLVEILLQLGDRTVDALAERHPSAGPSTRGPTATSAVWSGCPERLPSPQRNQYREPCPSPPRNG